MNRSLKFFVGFTLLLLPLALLLGVLAAIAYLWPETWNRFFPFFQLRPMHVSAALFWIIGGAVSGILFYRRQVLKQGAGSGTERAFIWLWIATVTAVFGFYAFRQFGGREYWEFPPLLGVPLLLAWVLLLLAVFRGRKLSLKNPPLYVWMWITGLVFFLITFLEQNLWQIPWFRASFLREITVQWKSNGAMVGAWNQMIYGSSLLVMVRLTGNEQLARNRNAYFFYFLGLTNLMFNWGHHIYNVPGASWIRHVSYAISMTEWIIWISIIREFKSKLRGQQPLRHLHSYRFLLASEFWIFLNLTLALLMSVPAINRYTHGTHITVAHAMGATIGINTMILLSTFAYMLRADRLSPARKRLLQRALQLSQLSLLVFWLALIAAGLLKGYRDVALEITPFQEMMRPVQAVLHVFAAAGIGLLAGLGTVAWVLIQALRQMPASHRPDGRRPEGLKLPVTAEPAQPVKN